MLNDDDGRVVRVSRSKAQVETIRRHAQRAMRERREASLPPITLREIFPGLGVKRGR